MSKGEGPLGHAKQLNLTVWVLGSSGRKTRCSARGRGLTCWNDRSTSSAASIWGSKSPSACEGTTSSITRCWGDFTPEFQSFQEMVKKTFASVTAQFCAWSLNPLCVPQSRPGVFSQAPFENFHLCSFQS